MQLLDLGDLALTMPLAAAAGAWLLAARAWRAAATWTALYGGTVALVGGSKIAYLGWGTDIALLGFKAFSGHAAGVTAVYPVLGYLLCRPAGRGHALALAGAGLVLGLMVAATLVRQGEHTVAEAAAGWLLGACASVGTLHQADTRGSGAGIACAASALAVFVLAAALMQSAHVGYWMIRLALALSGNARPFPWDADG